jgi:hypothetical protein
MRTSTDCTSRAEECRRLAKLAAQPEDWRHFIEMAATWDTLANQRKANKQVADELVAEVAEEELADEQLAAILALAGAIANGRDLRLGPVD